MNDEQTSQEEIKGLQMIKEQQPEGSGQVIWLSLYSHSVLKPVDSCTSS